jgi:hypothetical protein
VAYNDVFADAAEEINLIKEETGRAIMRGLIEIGNRLLEAKSLVPYGEWEQWLENNVSYSVRSAQDLMRIAKEYGRKETQALAEIQNGEFVVPMPTRTHRACHQPVPPGTVAVQPLTNGRDAFGMDRALRKERRILADVHPLIETDTVAAQEVRTKRNSPDVSEFTPSEQCFAAIPSADVVKGKTEEERHQYGTNLGISVQDIGALEFGGIGIEKTHLSTLRFHRR